MDSLEKQCTAIDEYIEKINTSIEFLQEKKRNGEHLDAEKEAYISSAIRLKVQKGMDKKPLRARIEEIQRIRQGNPVGKSYKVHLSQCKDRSQQLCNDNIDGVWQMQHSLRSKRYRIQIKFNSPDNRHRERQIS